MRFRPLALFALTAGLAVLLVELAPGSADAQEEAGKKNRKKADPPPAPVASLPVPKSRDAAALAKVIDAAGAKGLAEAKVPAPPRDADEEFLRRPASTSPASSPPPRRRRRSSTTPASTSGPG